MRNFFLFLLFPLLLFSCSHKNHLIYVNDLKTSDLNKIHNSSQNFIKIGDVLQINVKTAIAEVSVPYNNASSYSNFQNNDKLILDGYKVKKDSTINYPIIGEINVVGYTTDELAFKLRNIFISSGQLTNPHISVNIVNFKYTVLGEVRNPGTFINYDNQLNIFQALGFAGDLLITAKRKKIKLVREENGLRKTYKFSLNKKEIFDKPYYYIKSNDLIIVEPNYSKIKSAGFIGSPSSIASISSLVLSITLLLINN